MPMTDRLRMAAWPLPLLAGLAVLLLILFLRVTRGLDLGDEMQYYGQIDGLLRSGQLFSNDLFVQQTVYVPLYPLFYLYHQLAGFDGLILFGRLLLATLILGLYLHAARSLLRLGLPGALASSTALSLTFAVTYHGIFAPSYNTLSQLLWIVFALRFLAWPGGVKTWAALIVLCGFAHPPSALVMAACVLLRLGLQRQWPAVRQLLCWLLPGAAAATALLLQLATVEQWQMALAFSSGYGVGSGFTADLGRPLSVPVLYALFGLGYLYRHCLPGTGLAQLGAGLSLVAIALLLSGYPHGGYSLASAFGLALLTLVFYAAALGTLREPGAQLRLNWLLFILLCSAASTAISSSNGIGQATGSFMIALPLLAAIALHAACSGWRALAGSILISLLFIAHWSLYPYRDVSWWQQDTPITGIPEMRFIRSHSQRVELLQTLQHSYPQLAGNNTLIISHWPALYFALQARPETCMLYMHSLTSTRSEQALRQCLNDKHPAWVLDVSSSAEADGSRLQTVLRQWYRETDLPCRERDYRLDVGIGDYDPQRVTVVACGR